MTTESKSGAVTRTLKQIVAAYAVFLPLGFLARDAPELFAMLVLAAFSVIAPLTAVRQPFFWRTLGAIVLGWFALFLILPATCEALLGHELGEDAMVFLFPMMLFPIALLAAPLLRLIIGCAQPARE